jgi:hypothetical protein
VTVSKALGHGNVHLTLVTYAHAIPQERHGAGDALARLMAQGGNIDLRNGLRGLIECS